MHIKRVIIDIQHPQPLIFLNVLSIFILSIHLTYFFLKAVFAILTFSQRIFVLYKMLDSPPLFFKLADSLTNIKHSIEPTNETFQSLFFPELDLL